jgi:hypothetical protein
MKKPGLIMAIILAIVVAYGLAVYIPNQAKIAKVHSDLESLKGALYEYQLHHNHFYPFATADYQEMMVASYPRVLIEIRFDPFARAQYTKYGYKLSPNRRYYVIFSVGTWGRGEASVSDTGLVSAKTGAIWDTNGQKE